MYTHTHTHTHTHTLSKENSLFVATLILLRKNTLNSTSKEEAVFLPRLHPPFRGPEENIVSDTFLILFFISGTCSIKFEMKTSSSRKENSEIISD